MTINDIMLRDMAEEERRQRREEEMRKDDREICRMMWRRRLRTAGEVAAGILTLALFALLAWLFLAVTPDQCSAACEALRAEMDAQGE